MDPAYAGVYLNAMPTTDMKVTIGENTDEIQEFREALVKCEEKDSERVQGIIGY